MNCYDYISEKDIRKCRFYIRYMESRERSRIRIRTDFDWRGNSGNAEEMCYWINKTIEYSFGQNESVKNFLERMEASCKDEILPPYRDWETDRKSTRLNSSHLKLSRMPSSA